MPQVQYLAKLEEVPKIFLSRHKTGWIVNVTADNGKTCLPLALAVNKASADIIIEALAAKEQ